MASAQAVLLLISQKRIGAVGSDTALQAERSRVRFPMVALQFSIDIILPAGTMTLGSTQPLTEKSSRNIYWGGKVGRCVGLTTFTIFMRGLS